MKMRLGRRGMFKSMPWGFHDSDGTVARDIREEAEKPRAP